MNYLTTNKIKLLLTLIFLFVFFQVFKFIKVRIATMDLPKGKIVFSSDIDGDNEIYTMNVNGINLKQLTQNFATKTNTATDNEPSFSPDGKKIVFVSRRQGEEDVQLIYNRSGRPIGEKYSGGAFDIFIMDSDGSNQNPLTYQDLCSQPFFTPDGERVVFRAKKPESVRMIDIYTGNSKFLNRRYGGEFLFSRDGTRIYDNLNGDISVTDITGENRIRLANFSKSTGTINNGKDKIGIDFVLSPNEKRIALMTIGETGSQLSQVFKIYTMNVDGSDLKEIRRIETQNYSTISDFKYSPDRDKIIFVFNSDKQRMYSLDLVTGGLTDLTDKKENWVRFPWFNFTFTPDGKRIVFIGNIVPKNYPLVFFSHFIKGWIRYIFLRRSTPSYDNKYLCIMDIDGKNYRRITKLPEGTELGRDFIHWEK